MKYTLSNTRHALGSAILPLATLALHLATPSAHAAVGDTLTYVFNAPSTGGAQAANTRASLLLTETALGVNFLLTPDWQAAGAGNRVSGLQFAYSGDAATFVAGTGPQFSNPNVMFQQGAIDSGYSNTHVVVLGYSAGQNKFDDAFASSAWSLNGNGITLADFAVLATSPSKPSPAFGVISMPGASPSNWVAMGHAAPVPEPDSAALLLAGLGVVGWLAKRGA